MESLVQRILAFFGVRPKQPSVAEQQRARRYAAKEKHWAASWDAESARAARLRDEREAPR